MSLEAFVWEIGEFRDDVEMELATEILREGLDWIEENGDNFDTGFALPAFERIGLIMPVK